MVIHLPPLPLSPNDTPVVIHWFRRDLRLSDNAALYHALKYAQAHNQHVLPLFIYDAEILQHLPPDDQRVAFIHNAISYLQHELQALGSSLVVAHGKAVAVWEALQQQLNISAVFTNRDYEPYARERDNAVAHSLALRGTTFNAYKDHVILERQEVLTDAGKVYHVFTPYKRKWLSVLTPFHLKAYPTERYFHAFTPTAPLPAPTLPNLGFHANSAPFPPQTVTDTLIQHYAERRDYPAVAGTSRLGVHLRFGTVSIRALARQAQALSEVFISELIWRDFYSMLLDAYPHIVSSAFKPEYDAITWRDAPADFERWCNGQTGYPLVDAGMRELNTTGYMHNRVRMVTASFLTKHLLIDWRLGEAYFALKLLDFDLASNNGGWQWAASTGCDAAPYFRIFNPSEQARKFDPQYSYIQRWLPEWNTARYPATMVEHRYARARALDAYKQGLNKEKGVGNK